MRSTSSPNQTLWTLRLLWMASIMTQVVFAAAVVAFAPDAQSLGPPMGRQLVYIVAAALLILTPVGYFVRNQVYKAHWQGHAISPEGYFTGNLALHALMEGVGFAAIVIAWLAGEPLPGLYITGGAILVQLINFPTGRPMQPTPPTFSERDRS